MKKNLSLEGLRGLACLVVAIGHFAFVFSPILAAQFSPIPGATILYTLEHLLTYPPFSLLYSAEAAVCVFFVMSGYVLTAKYWKTGDVVELQKGASKRYVRLVIPAFASVMLAWALWKTGAIITTEAGPIGVAGWVPSWYVGPYPFFGSVFNGLIGAPLFAHTTLNSPLWTIQVELIGSVLLFAMIAAFGRNPFWLCAWFLFFADVLGYYLPNVLFYFVFFVGYLLHPARDWLRSHQAVSLALAAVGLVCLAFNLNPAFDWMREIKLPNLQPYGPDFNANVRLFWNSIGAVLLVAGVIGSKPLDAILSLRIPVFLGKISFSLYVIHMPLVMSVGLRASRFWQEQGASYGTAAILAFLTYIFTAIALATLFYRWVDLPAIKLAGRIADRTLFKGRAKQAEVAS